MGVLPDGVPCALCDQQVAVIVYYPPGSDVIREDDGTVSLRPKRPVFTCRQCSITPN